MTQIIEQRKRKQLMVRAEIEGVGRGEEGHIVLQQ
jgi:hypothetical protein